ncbi:MAG: CusA/CzcA family heavy metal efflux RND transporter [Bacteroidetes bacterium]|nr:MAG: CusA/CzcA family heavy metal efflux RND transporter [Bacteroidota bacterium]
MLNKIIQYSLDNRMLIIFLSLMLVIAGLFTARDMEIDVFPDLTAPTVVVLTDAHGMAAEEVEALVTFPIESSLNGATDVRRVRSSSSYGFSIVWVEFDWNTDIYRARQIVSEKLPTIAALLPKHIEAPIIAPQTSVMGEVMLVSLTSDSLSMFDLRTITDKQVRQRLLSVTGVSQVVVIGGLPKQYQILVDPHKMKYHDISLEDLISTAENTNSNAAGGIINQYGQEYAVRATGRSTNPADIGSAVIRIRNGKPVKIADVAEVKIGHPDRVGDAWLDMEPAVILTILKQPNVNTLTLTSEVESALAELQSTLPDDVQINSEIFRQADFINTAVSNVFRVLLEGGLFVSIILFLFLLNVRTTIISLVAIPLSLMLSLITLKLLGLTINTMSLGGMAIAIGALVDDAIIDVENVLKRLKQNHRLPKAKQQGKLQVIYQASVEIRSSIVQATLIIIVSFIPLFFLAGMEGRMLKPLGITFIVSLVASLVVALTLTPVLSSYMLTGKRQLEKDERGGNRLVQHLNSWYLKALPVLLKWRLQVVILAAGLLVFALILFSRFGNSFLPEFNEGTLTITAVTFPGVSLEESNRLIAQIDSELMEVPEVEYVCRRTGRAELNEHSHGGTNSAEIDVPYTLGERDHEAFMEDVRERLSYIQGINLNIGQPLGHRIDHMLSGTRASIAIKLFGTDLGAMYRTATQIQEAISSIPGLVDLNVEQLVEVPQIQIRPRREMLARYGISQNQLTQFVETAIAGEKYAEVYDENLNYPLVVRYNESHRNSKEAIEDALIDTYDGNHIPLSYVADVVSTSGPNTINRENVQRKLVISANTAGRDLGSVVSEIQSTIESQIELPEGYRIQYGGQFKSAQNASLTLLITSLLAILVIFVILFQEFKSGKMAGVILLNLPLALIGGVVAIWITNRVVSIPSIIGFITLFGIATRNGILLVSRYIQLRKDGQGLKETIILGSADRLNPILMTALASALALIPLAMGGDKPGNEIQSPMAIVILGGLVTSTLLNLIVIPAVYYMIEKRKA